MEAVSRAQVGPKIKSLNHEHDNKTMGDATITEIDQW